MNKLSPIKLSAMQRMELPTLIRVHRVSVGAAQSADGIAELPKATLIRRLRRKPAVLWYEQHDGAARVAGPRLKAASHQSIQNINGPDVETKLNDEHEPTRTRAGTDVDEKMQVQALNRTQPGLLLKKNGPKCLPTTTNSRHHHFVRST